jgi:hypothetical protein
LRGGIVADSGDDERERDRIEARDRITSQAKLLAREEVACEQRENADKITAKRRDAIAEPSSVPYLPGAAATRARKDPDIAKSARAVMILRWGVVK